MSASKKEARPKGTSNPQKKSPAKTKPKSRAKGSGGKTKAGSTAKKSLKPAFLPLFSIWFVAVVVLASLLYWAGSNTIPSGSTASHYDGGKGTSEHRHTGTRHPGQSPTEHDTNRSRAMADASRPHEAPPLAQQQHPGGKPGPSSAVPSPSRSAASQGNTSLALNRPPSTPPPPAPSPPSSYVPPAPPSATPVARVAIVIDDFGRDIKAAEQFLTIPMPLTFSVLPFRPHSGTIVQLVHSRGREVILHVPMQPIQYPKIDPGQGALLVSMSPQQIREVLRKDLDAYPHVAGINNHMGSRFTESSRDMTIVLEELHRRGLFFLDSYTTDRSIGYTLARTLHVPTARRDVFLDDASTASSIRFQIHRLIEKAKRHGSAIAIGHPHPSTYKVLQQEADLFRQEHIAVVPLKELIQR